MARRYDSQHIRFSPNAGITPCVDSLPLEVPAPITPGSKENVHAYIVTRTIPFSIQACAERAIP